MDMPNLLFGCSEMSKKGGVNKATERDCRRQHTKLLKAAGVWTFALILTSVTSPPTSHAAFPGENGKIAFDSTRDGHEEIYVMDADGMNQIRLTNIQNCTEADSTFRICSNNNPSWSPDGTKIAFTSNRDSQSINEVYVMNADGSGQTNLTNNAASDSSAGWSPDGTQIAFTSDRDGNSELYVMNADGSGQTRLTTNPDPDFDPTWSPDGTKILFLRIVGGSNFEVFVMNADGTGQTNLTNHPRGDGSPSWSPDGTEIAFSSGRDNPQGDIFLMDANGDNKINLTNLPTDDGTPAWSPDGTKIVFNSNRRDVGPGFGDREIYIMDANGDNQINLSNGTAEDGRPDWQTLGIVDLIIENVKIDLKDGKFGIKGHFADVTDPDFLELLNDPQFRIRLELQTGGTPTDPEFGIAGEDQVPLTSDGTKMNFPGP